MTEISKIITPKNRLIFNYGDKSVTKYFRSRDEFDKELFIYEKRKDFAPELLFYHKSELTITMKMIDGITIVEQEKPDFERLAALFYELHTMTEKTICLIDTNPRNFLFSPSQQKYFIIDFSDWRYEKKEFDLIHFLLFWASLLEFEKFSFNTTIFLNEYEKLNSIDKSAWKNITEEAIEIFDLRRNLHNKKEKKINKDLQKNRLFIKNYSGFVKKFTEI